MLIAGYASPFWRCGAHLLRQSATGHLSVQRLGNGVASAPESFSEPELLPRRVGRQADAKTASAERRICRADTLLCNPSAPRRLGRECPGHPRATGRRGAEGRGPRLRLHCEIDRCHWLVEELRANVDLAAVVASHRCVAGGLFYSVGASTMVTSSMADVKGRRLKALLASDAREVLGVVVPRATTQS